MKNTFILIIGLVLFNACHKNDPATAASIEFEEPILNDTIHYMDSLHAEGTIVGNGKMQGFSLDFIDAASGTILESENSAAVESEYAFHSHWHNVVTDTTVVTVKVTVNLDKNGAKSTAERQVVCLPQ